MSEDKTLVSIVMPMYNTKEEELRNAIDSILCQTYENFEFIIIDDGSKNNCIDVVKTYNDTRIKLLINENNLGIEESLNKGIKNSKSDYIFRMDSDDVAYKNRIEIQMGFLEKYPQFDFVGTKVDFFNDKEGIVGESKKYGEINKKDFLYGTPIIHPTMLIKKRALEDVGMYEKSFRTEDYLLQIKLFVKGYKGYIIDEKLLKYRLDENTYLRRSKKQRINELKIKIRGFKMLKVKWYQYIYLLKPVLAMIIPFGIMKKYHKIHEGKS